MTGAALALALAAAVLHASWNLILARASDVQAATAVVLGLSVVLFAPVAVITWDVEPEVWPYALVSGVFEFAYIGLLAYAYSTAELSVVYPVSRGLAPVLVLAAGVTAVTVAEAFGVISSPPACCSCLRARSARAPACGSRAGRGRTRDERGDRRRARRRPCCGSASAQGASWGRR